MNGANACPRVVQKFIGAYGKWRRLPEKFGIRLIQRFIFVGSILLLCVGNNSEALADDRSGSPARAKTMRAWALSLDNDLFVPLSSSDRDYTGGIALTYSGDGGSVIRRPFDYLQGAMDQLLGAPKHKATTTSMEVGTYGFTPDDIQSADVLASDRPYASLVYISSSRMYALSANRSISTSLTWGVLGTHLFGELQRRLHRAVGNQPIHGWHHQISDGGELTGRYQIAHHKYWQADDFRSRIKTTVFSSVGYLTELGAALSTRRGLISSPDHRFNPELIAYGERVNDIVTAPYQGEESYFWGGISFKVRLYNAFFQGQFRHSAHTLRYRDLRPVIGEAWLGYTFTIGQHYRASYVVRAHTSEIRSGAGNRHHIWGGFVFSRYF